jgi:Cu+-exporting ATPase
MITLSNMEARRSPYLNKGPVIKIAIAGFCFGNIMMMSFPEYFGLENIWEQEKLQWLFRYLNLVLSLPVLLYSASDFFSSAIKSIRQRYLNIDAPIALAIAVTFTRSVYEIVSGTGAGYLDSMTGIVFFMLIGRYVQNRTYDTLSFDRDYKSWFPLAVRVLEGVKETSKQVSQLKAGDVIVVRNQELIPADARLLSSHTHIDYSFVTGESAPVPKSAGDLIYAGGRQLEGAVTLSITRGVSQSYLTRLWNDNAQDREKKRDADSLTDRINRYFTITVLLVAGITGLYWLLTDPSKALNAFSAILIVACPCGLLLTATFTNGSLIRILGHKGYYLKNAEAIGAMANIDTIVFDKTGTITHGSTVVFKGELTEHELCCAVSLAAQSAHVLSRKIDMQHESVQRLAVTGFKETTGQGIEGTVGGMFVRMGSEYYISGSPSSSSSSSSSRVFVSMDGVVKGFFSIGHSYRPGLESIIRELGKKYELHMLSGDNSAEREHLEKLFPSHAMHFDQKPDDKLVYIQNLQLQGKYVMMIGDGLNDAHAFTQSDMSVAVSDDTNNFSPACDAILSGRSFALLPGILRFVRKGRTIISACFTFSLIYNIIGLCFAVKGSLSPVVAAILMPASSVSIVLISTLSVYFSGKRALQ